MERNISRREFLKGMAVTGAIAAAGTLAGCAKGGTAIKWDKEVDVLVVGSGTAALAAIAAKDAGAGTVLIIEKGATFGGTSALSGGGMWIPNNYVMREQGIADSKEDALEYLRRVTEGQSDEELLNAYLDNAPEMIEWLRDKFGIQWMLGTSMFNDYYEVPGFRKFGRTVYPAKDGQNLGGRGFWEILRGICSSLGVEVMLETAGKKLIVSDAGEVIGVVADSNGQQINIKARKGVILGTGGFDYNKDMVRHFLSGPIFASNAVPTNTGDGHLMAMAIGADLRNMKSCWGLPFFPLDPDKMQGEADWQMYRGKPGAIVVNKYGERIGNEASSYHLFLRAFWVWDTGTFEWRNIPAFWICDATFPEHYPMPGSGFKMGVIPDWIKKADTLEELCEILGIDARGLKATLEVFNENAREGKDPIWHRGEYEFDRGTAGDLTGKRTDLKNNCLAPVEKPPFYGAPYVPGTCGTNGGLRINGYAQVLDVWGKVIPRLYAVGNASGSVMGAAYPGGGSTLGAGCVFAMLAGRHAASLGSLA